MKFSRFFIFACVASGSITTGRAADAIQSVDYTRKDLAFTPAATITPATQTPQPAAGIQDKRVDVSTLDKKTSALGERRAAIDVQQTRDKNIREKDSHRPEGREPAISDFNHRESSITTGSDSKRPDVVSKYQASLTAASAANMARFPVTDGATTAKINRFVFRKNAPDGVVPLGGGPVTPAAGGSAVTK